MVEGTSCRFRTATSLASDGLDSLAMPSCEATLPKCPGSVGSPPLRIFTGKKQSSPRFDNHIPHCLRSEAIYWYLLNRLSRFDSPAVVCHSGVASLLDKSRSCRFTGLDMVEGAQ
jgi:hypothetical protein